MRPKNLEKEAAIRRVALRIISEEGLENLSMQRLAKEAGVSPRTIYIKYQDKEDLLVKLFIEEVLYTYEQALLEGFSDSMDLAVGVRHLWLNAFRYFTANPPAYVLMQYGQSSPLLNKVFQKKNIKQGQFFAPVHRLLKKHASVIKNLPFEAQRALLFAPLLDLVHEYFEPQQVITESIVMTCCETVIKGIML